MKLMVLNKNEKLGCNNINSSFRTLFEKLKEEVNELEKEVEKEDMVNMTAETLDVVQMCIALLLKLFMNGINIENAIHRHNRKLTNRNWKPRAIIKISIK